MHELDMSRGFAAIAYRDTEKPWHGLGAEMTGNESLEEWRQRAGLDFSVRRKPVFTFNSDGERIPIPNRRALVRSDNQKPLSIVGERYKVVQPREVLEFFRSLIVSQGFEMETAGALADGKRVWALARTGKDFKLPGVEDRMLAYLLLATSYDKTFATTAQFTSVRVVCQNTLGFSLAQGEGSDGKQVFRVSHSASFDADEAQGNLGLLGESWSQFSDQVERLANTPVSKEQAVRFFMDVLGYDEEDPVKAAQSIRSVKSVLESYESAPGQDLPSARNTAWGLVNGLTHWTDHARRARNSSTRLDSAWFGNGNRLKRKGFESALRLAEAA